MENWRVFSGYFGLKKVAEIYVKTSDGGMWRLV
jgi:hypothetical protein